MGLGSVYGYRMAWTTQAFVVIARGFGTAEFATGFWKVQRRLALAIRLLIACGGTVLISTLHLASEAYSLLSSRSI